MAASLPDAGVVLSRGRGKGWRLGRYVKMVGTGFCEGNEQGRVMRS